MISSRSKPACRGRRLSIGAWAAALAALVASAGCRLVDQRTFAGTVLAPSGAQLAAGDQAAALPLVSIRFDRLDIDWQPPLLDATRGALARQPDAQFDLVTPVPVQASLDLQDRALTSGVADMQQVADVLLADGVAADHVHLGSRGDPGQPVREVRVYVR